MPGRLYLTRSLSDVAHACNAESQGLDLKPRRNIAPGQEILVCTGARHLVHMRWGLIPVGRVNARGRPVMETIVNARSETVFDKSAFQGVGRCLVPVDGWYEWTGARRKKTPWAISRRSGDLCVFAAIFDRWLAPGGTEILQVATLTCAPNGDLRDIHDRMGVILEPRDFDTWLHGEEAAARALLRPLPDGLLRVQSAADEDLSGDETPA